MATQHADVKRLRAPFEAFVVDGFNFTKTYPGVRHWPLTHAHGDHTCGLSGAFDAGTIYCSTITKRLVCANISQRLEARIRTIDIGESIELGATKLTALDAGHCPGSLLFLFEHVSGVNVLHTGDMRASPAVRDQPGLAPFRAGGPRQLDLIYLDTTYANKNYDFPPQAEACAEIRSIVQREMHREPKTLIMCNAYTIGKENAFDA
eukprot:CAMPEP_0119289148 /NCGR_PEP_ID=MMETSP1329-20130426/38543_1 /TAXON_ID=114041 /ORGANISM="Genus nov. species nov., Strain RCC1024" /LENGTH=205 /DNA_ID=CAMNT_0007289939 /DNA_START=177 /DNA_END=790 /DNA_ORIENTATION=+